MASPNQETCWFDHGFVKFSFEFSVVVIHEFESQGEKMSSSSAASSSEFYSFTVPDAQGNEVSMSEYKGKVLMIVNVASSCGLTPQYEELQQLYEKYKDQGFEILAFPCNQFAFQERGSNEEICQFARKKFNVSFKIFAKVCMMFFSLWDFLLLYYYLIIN